MSLSQQALNSEFGKVAVLLGGSSAEREVSLKSGAAVLSAFERSGLNVFGIDTADYDLHRLVEEKFTHAFIALHGRGGEDGTLQGALEFLDIPYTGSRVLGSALAMDKGRCKQIWQSLELPTADFKLVEKDSYQVDEAASLLVALGGKVMVKPCLEGSSIGMAIASNCDELKAAIDMAFEYDQQVLIERWLSGAEYTVAILGQTALPSIRMSTPHDFYDYTAKYQSNSTQYFCPSGLSPEQEQELGQIALRAFQAAGCEGWGRVDFMQDENGGWNLLEVNTSPGMTEKSLVPMAAKQLGMSFEQLVLKILELAH
ncbi:D-alanine--D-alanine ligase [Alginatibacterium sediminis]|uniref:D-alanine--D-alanine ligase n=1 Tax=Alginatibacterium sediminis TaxID=2164068 RepID=A0A420E9L9_9ALTE|nr:D-alanine--D-alanine ligase [Alginatibacterium sediminis]RKF15882.1 D-alanine--D-alanine ligase [Alginatibacterium sediminis]